MSKIYMTQELLQACNEISKRGHGVELEALEGGNNHSSVRITICFRKKGEAGHSHKIGVKLTQSYGQFSDFIGEHGELGYYQQKSILPFLEEYEPA